MPTRALAMEILAELEKAAVLFGLAYVAFVIREKVWCWPTGIVSAALYVLVFYDARLYGQVALQGVYIVLMVYGWYQWRHGGEGRGKLAVSRTPPRWGAALAGSGAVLTLALGLLESQTDAALPFWDAGTVSFSLVAQFMTTRKWMENWLVWIAVDVIYVGMYVSQGLYWTTALFATFLILAVVGLGEWRRSLRRGAAEEAA